MIILGPYDIFGEAVLMLLTFQNTIVGGNLGVALPLLIFGGLSVGAGLLMLFLPETSNRVLPDTVEEAKNFGRFDK